MPAQLVQIDGRSGVNSGASFAFPVAPTVGNTIIAICRKVTAAVTVSDGQGGVWTTLYQADNSIHVAKRTGGSPLTGNVNQSTNYGSSQRHGGVYLLEISGLVDGGVLDGTPTVSSGTGTVVSDSHTTGLNSVGVAVFNQSEAAVGLTCSNFTAGWTFRAPNSGNVQPTVAGLIHDIDLGASGAKTAELTVDSSLAWQMTFFALNGPPYPIPTFGFRA